jgi:NTP pyrophosphatase (non-canonical NTP hydrolase)
MIKKKELMGSVGKRFNRAKLKTANPTRSFHMDNQLQELLTITMEECGELIQACSKAIRCDEYYDNQNLLEELGDVQQMIELIHDYDLVSWEAVQQRMKVKREKLTQWSDLI